MRIKSLAQGENILMLGIEPSTFVSKIEVLTTTPIVHEGAVVLDILEVIKFCRVQNKPLIIGTTAEEMFVIKATNENISTTDIIITLLATRTKDIIPILFQYRRLYLHTMLTWCPKWLLMFCLPAPHVTFHRHWHYKDVIICGSMCGTIHFEVQHCGARTIEVEKMFVTAPTSHFCYISHIMGQKRLTIVQTIILSAVKW